MIAYIIYVREMLKLIKKHRQAIIGVAAYLILKFHCQIPIYPENLKIPYFIDYFIMKSGFYGVDITLLLSGFGLVNSINNNSLSKYYKHRISRIIIPFVLMGVRYYFYYEWNLKTLILNITGINFYLKNTLSFLWFIPAISTLYLLFPLYYKWYKKQNNKLMATIISLIVWLIPIKCLESLIRHDFFIFINRIPVFLIGIYFGQLSFEKKDYNNKTIIIFFSILLLLFGSYEMHLCKEHNHYLFITDSSTCIPALCLALSSTIILSYIFEKIPILAKPFSWLGTFSLEIYCYYNLIRVRSFYRILALTGKPIYIYLLLMLCTILISYIFKLICDLIKCICIYINNKISAKLQNKV